MNHHILNKEVPYTDVHNFLFTKEKDSILNHTIKLIDHIINKFIPKTSLICYGEGDWDDTLQPADISMREKMVSGWTVSLIYQTFCRYSKICNLFGQKELADKLQKICNNIKEDVNKYLIKDNVIAGFAYFNDINNIDYLLHPKDNKTGVNYRLLPMTRGIISEIFTKEQAEDHVKIIFDKLFFPDGVRLMNAPVLYKGGVRAYFRRAEEASNFGREMGLLYVHAHIRFIEAMAKIGNADAVYKGLLAVLPINIDKAVPNALLRQSNAYFSSSDGCFNDRYEAEKNFEKLKTGKVKIASGWRIYSSGPGIYINQIVSNFLGIREWFSYIIIDPVIPKYLNGLKFDYNYGSKKIQYVYNIKHAQCGPIKITINGKNIDFERDENPYRQAGAKILKSIFEGMLVVDRVNELEIYL